MSLNSKNSILLQFRNCCHGYEAVLSLCFCCFIHFPAAVAPSTILYIAVSVVGVCVCTWMTMCFQQMAFCSEPSGGISPPSSGCYLTAHLLLWSPLTETPLTPSPPHPTEANQLGSSPGQELLAVRIASGLVRHRHRESVMRRSGMIVCILSVCPLMTKSLSVLPLTIMTNNQLLHHCHNLPPPATAACYQSSVFSPPGSALWIQLDEWAVLGRAHRDQTWWLSLELDSLPQPVWCERVITSVCLVWPLIILSF